MTINQNKKILFYIITIFYIIYAIYAMLYNSITVGFESTILFWSFCVLATPIPEAGIIFDLPLKIFFNMNMILSQIIVTFIAIIITLYYYVYNIKCFETTKILYYYKLIIDNKQASIFIISAAGTFTGLYAIEWLIDNIDNLYKSIIIDKNYRIKFY